MFQCHQCSKQFEPFSSLSKHIGRIHKIHASQSYIEYMLNGVAPKCECGCGQTPKWRAGSFQRFVLGHNARGTLNGMFGKNHTEESRGAMSKTRKAKYASGETHMWSEGLHIETSKKLQEMARKISANTKRAKKISDYFRGRPKSEEHKQKMWEGHRRWLSTNVVKYNNKLERKFSTILDVLKIEYTHPFSVQNKVYDFYIPSKNILIEVDGDFWHCNPNTKWNIPVYECQQVTISNDKNKNDIAQQQGYTLLRFWESDINNNPQKVIKELLSALEKVAISTT